jgi:hypothetical protein
MKFSDVFVIVWTNAKGSSYNDRLYTTYSEAFEDLVRIGGEFFLAIITLEEYNEERYSYGYDSGYADGCSTYDGTL